MNPIDEQLKVLEDRFEDGWPKCVAVNDSWIPKLIELDAKLSKVVPNYTVCQIKDKFGGLRFYLSYPYDLLEELQDIVSEYERESYKW